MNRESERKRLVELINGNSAVACYLPPVVIRGLADHLLDNNVMPLSYKPFPVVLSEDENNADVFCPFCNTNLSGHYYGGDYEPPRIVPCFGCGTWLDATQAITREEAEAKLKGGEE